MRKYGIAFALLALVACRQDPAPQPKPSPAPTVAVRSMPTPVPLPTWDYTPTPVIVPTPTATPEALAVLPSPPDPPPVGNNASGGSVVGNGSGAGVVTNTPAPTPTPTATPSVTPSPTISQTHVQSVVYGSNSPNTGSPYSEASPGPWAPYVTWVWTPLYNWVTAMHTAGLKLIVYDTPMSPKDSSGNGPCTASTSTVYDCTLLRTGGTYNSVAARDSSGNIVTTYSGVGISADPTTASFPAYVAADLSNLCATIKGHTSTAYDAIFEDNNAGPLAGGYSATPATWNAATWGQDFATAMTSLGTLPSCYANDEFATNTFGLGDTIQSTLVSSYLNSTAMISGMYEGCFTNGYGWFATEDSDILAVAFLKAHSKPANSLGWWCYADEQSLTGSTATQARMYIYASFLMAYDPNYSSFQESFSTPPSNIPIFPETQFVPLGPSLTASDPIVTSPLCATTCTTSGYSMTGGVFVQYFTNGCYYQGTKVSNSCEVAVNPTGSTTWSTGAVTGGTTQTIPNPNGFAHQMTVSGGGIMDGGTVSFSSPSTTSLAPQSGEILVP